MSTWKRIDCNTYRSGSDEIILDGATGVKRSDCGWILKLNGEPVAAYARLRDAKTRIVGPADVAALRLSNLAQGRGSR